MTEELQYKIDNNIKLTDEETKILLKDILLKEQKEQKENVIPSPKPIKTQEQKWLDGDEELPNHLKIVNGKIEQKSPKELFKDKIWTKEEYSEYQRSIRDGLLAETDKYMLSDFPIIKEKKDIIIKYRQMLRDLPQKKEFPDVEIVKFDAFEKQSAKGGKK